ncbi:hypothetical protein Q0F99_19185 [Rathayibacter oskolensis]|nr:hypothetical protein [Rathayibacter oskolensis]WKK71465.1 hypothetical protein Q0F99_19185 [Rathayibacter oskolensis]
MTDEDKSLGSDFGNTPEEIAEYKKKKQPQRLVNRKDQVYG